MFHSEAAVNTGEPPTDPLLWSSAGVSYEDLEAGSVGETGDQEVVHEADSGYENSPSSTAGNNAFNFDQEYSAGSAGNNDVSRTPDATSRSFPLPGCDSTNLAGNEDLRPSSSPISIPLRSTFDSSLADNIHQSRSNPVRDSDGPSNFQMMVGSSVYPLPLSWPTMTLWGLSHGRWEQRSVRPEVVEGGTRRGLSTNRRLLIDSDASSVSSSESDGPEDVFDAEVDFLSSLSLTEHPSAPCQVPPTLLQPHHAARRNRSVSVNLPVDRRLAEAISDVGRSLRRLSDEFSQQRQVGRGVITRRCTIGDFDSSTLRQLECDDSDDTFLAVVSEQHSTT